MQQSQQIIISSPLRKKISLQDFQVQHIIGKGAYGDVFLALKQGQKYAIKQILKRKLSKQKKQYQALVQKQLLRCMKHPGIIKMKYAFQDKHKLYFVLEYCEMGEFIKFMREYGEFLNQNVRKFYVAQIVNVLEYLHQNQITHRDIKVIYSYKIYLIFSHKIYYQRKKDIQNQQILGHHKLVNAKYYQPSSKSIFKNKKQNNKAPFNRIQHNSKLMKQYNSNRHPQENGDQRLLGLVSNIFNQTNTQFFSYISPQLLQHNICASSSDLWALGCIIYQLYYLQTPFKAKTQYGIFEKIKNVQLQFPKNDLITCQAIDLIKKLLVKDPEQRLGSNSREQLNFQHLKKHQYFKGIDIDNIYSFIPPDLQIKKPSYEPRQQAAKRIQQFQQYAKQKLLKFYLKQQIIVDQKIFFEGLIQYRQLYPNYNYAYLMITQNKEVLIISQPIIRRNNIIKFKIKGFGIITNEQSQFIKNNQNLKNNLILQPEINLFKIDQNQKKQQNVTNSNLKLTNKFYLTINKSWPIQSSRQIFKTSNTKQWIEKLSQLFQNQLQQNQKIKQIKLIF